MNSVPSDLKSQHKIYDNQILTKFIFIKLFPCGDKMKWVPNTEQETTSASWWENRKSNIGLPSTGRYEWRARDIETADREEKINKKQEPPSRNVNKIYRKQSEYIDGLVQDCGNSSALALELLQSCTKPSIYINVFESNGCVVRIDRCHVFL